MSSSKHEYRLIRGRHSFPNPNVEGENIIVRPGDTMNLTPEQVAFFGDRVVPVGQPAPVNPTVVKPVERTPPPAKTGVELPDHGAKKNSAPDPAGISSGVSAPAPVNKWSEVLADLNAGDSIALVNKQSELDDVLEIQAAEIGGKNRKSVLEAINARIEPEQ